MRFTQFGKLVLTACVIRRSGPFVIQQGFSRKLKRGVGLVAFGVGLFLGVQLGSARAAPPVAEWLSRLSTPTVRAALGSEAGRSFMSVLGVADREGLAHLLSISGSSARGRGIQVLAREVEEQLVGLRQQASRFRELVEARRIEAVASGNLALARELGRGLEAAEIELARVLGAKIFRVIDQRRLRAMLRDGESTDFVGLGAALSRRGQRTFLRRLDDGSEIFDRIARLRGRARQTTAEAAAAEELSYRWRSWLARMDACLEARPTSQMLRQRLTYWATEIGIEEAITVSSRVLGQSAANYVETGVWQIDLTQTDWDGIDVDMAVTLFATAFGGAVLSTSNRYWVQWRRFTAAQIGADNSLDAVLYFISPAERVMQQDPSLPELSDVAARYGLASSYSLANTWHEVGVYHLVDGLSCLYGGNWRLTAGLLGARVIYSVGSHSAYFGLRYITLDQ